MYEAELGQHLAKQDRIDETAFCVSCGEIVYLHDRGSYKELYPDGVICMGCRREQDAMDAVDAGMMDYAEWQEHWQVVAGEVIPR